MKIGRQITTAAVVMFIFVPSLAFAQTLPGTSPINLSITPQFPQPHEAVGLEVTSFSVDLNRATIVWYINDERVRSGIGERALETRVGAPGELTRVEVFVTPVSGRRITAAATLRPASVDILWHAHAYAPPFYRGKALPPSRGFIVFTAIPELVSSRGLISSPSDVVYTWKQLGITLGNASGYGRNRIVLKGEAVSQQPMNVSVVATSFDGTLEAQRSIQLRVRAPQILFYEKHPLEGVRREHALDGAFTLEGDEVTLRAEPYFFSLDDIANNRLLYKWRVNGKTVDIPTEKKSEITLRRESEAGGSVTLSLEIINDNLGKVLQEAFGNLRILLKTGVRL